MPGMESWGTIIMLVGLLVIMYFMMIRPQKKQEKLAFPRKKIYFTGGNSPLSSVGHCQLHETRQRRLSRKRDFLCPGA